MVNQKNRRHSGRKTVAFEDHHKTYYSDWYNYRDGFRAPFDKTKIRPENINYVWFDNNVKKDNKKNKKLLLRRKAMKDKRI